MLSELRFALRSLAKAPGFTSIAILTLALGLGANAGVFSFLNTLLTRPLPLPQVDELLFVGEHSAQVPNMSVAYPNFLDWRERQRSFTHLGAFRNQSFNYLTVSEVERVVAAHVSHDLLPALGVTPLLGRRFGANDDRPGAGRTVVIGERFWRRAFAGDPGVIGREINLSGELYTVVGVLPVGFIFPSPTTDLWAPIGLWADQHSDRGNHPGIYCVGRLRPGVTAEAARADLVGIARQLEREYPQSNTGNSVTVESLVDRVVGQARQAVWSTALAAFGVLLIACANVANLLLARSAARGREFAIRLALGSGRGGILRLVLAECLILGLAGTALGLVFGHATMQGIRSLIPEGTPFLTETRMDATVFAFSTVMGVGVTLLAGLVPALAGARADPNAALAAGGRTSGGLQGRWRSALIAGEFALTVALLFVSGLMFRTIQNVYQASTGLRTEGVLTFTFDLPGREWSDASRRTQLLGRALERLRALPGVTHAALVNPLPLSGGGNQTSFLPEGMPDPGPGRWFSTENNAASADTFAALGIPIVRGRTFTDREQPGDERVCLIDTTFAATHFAGQDPIGRRVVFGGSGGNRRTSTIIGVVGHVANYGVGRETRVQLYYPYRQSCPTGVKFVLRTTQDPAALAGAVRAAMHEVEPTLPIFTVRTMEEVFERTVTNQRIMMTLLGVFAGLAVLLAAVGLYGVLSYVVGQRTREIGIRIALGAPLESIRRMLLGQGLRLAALGFAVGAAAAYALARLIASMLYGVAPHDPLNLGLVAVLLTAVGLAASWLPARRAMRVNPVETLRTD